MTFSTATLDMPVGHGTIYRRIDPQTGYEFYNVQPLTIHRDFIYVVMMCERMGVKNFLQDFGSSRLVGWYGAYETAVSAVMENWCGINEHCYDYALIEKIEEGLYKPANSSERWWFKYNQVTDTYDPVEEPKEYEHYSGFTIG